MMLCRSGEAYTFEFFHPYLFVWPNLPQRIPQAGRKKMKSYDEMVQLAKMLEIEFNTGSIDRVRARELAERLLPHHPELRNTLTSVRNRMERR